MARGNAEAQAGARNALSSAQNLQGQSGSLYSTLAPALTADVTHPTGMTPEEKAAANTAAQQSAGGGEAAAVGQGALMAQRTRNAGAPDAAIGEAARGAGRNLSTAALNTELEDTALKQRKEAAAKGEMGSLYGISTGAGNQALGQVASNVNANTNAANESWDWAKYILDPAMQAAGQGAGLAAGCWIAEAIYGQDDERTHLVRAWLNGPFNHGFGALVMWVYLHIGQPIAALVRHSPLLRRAMKPLFDLALNRALDAISFDRKFSGTNVATDL